MTNLPVIFHILLYIIYYTFVYSLERKLYIMDSVKSQGDWIKGYVKS